MHGLISDLLDAGRIKAGALSVKPRADGWWPSWWTERRIVQVLNNLLSNGRPGYSPETSPIRVAAVSDGVHVAISVFRRGRGVPPDHLPHLFRRYAGVAARGGRSASGGAGLGLVICKGLVEAHGGRIQAESGGSGQGSRFHLHRAGRRPAP